MVYERLPRKIKHHQTRHPDEPSHRVTFILRSVPVALLATCRLVHDEAKPIVQDLTKKFILEAPPRIIDGVSGRGEGRMLDALIRAFVKQADVLRGWDLGRGPCLTISQLFDGHLRTALLSKRSSRYLTKIIHQAGHQLHYSSVQADPGAFQSIEIVKYTSALSGIGRHWALGADLHALNTRLQPRSIAVVCAGVLPAGVAERGTGSSGDVLIPQYVNFQAYGLECYIPSSRPMDEETWIQDWLE